MPDCPPVLTSVQLPPELELLELLDDELEELEPPLDEELPDEELEELELLLEDELLDEELDELLLDEPLTVTVKFCMLCAPQVLA